MRRQVHHAVQSIKIRRTLHREEKKPRPGPHQLEDDQIYHWNRTSTIILDQYWYVLEPAVMGVLGMEFGRCMEGICISL
jgi:hypothetical protein